MAKRIKEEIRPEYLQCAVRIFKKHNVESQIMIKKYTEYSKRHDEIIARFHTLLTLYEKVKKEFLSAAEDSVRLASLDKILLDLLGPTNIINPYPDLDEDCSRVKDDATEIEIAEGKFKQASLTWQASLTRREITGEICKINVKDIDRGVLQRIVRTTSEASLSLRNLLVIKARQIARFTKSLEIFESLLAGFQGTLLIDSEQAQALLEKVELVHRDDAEEICPITLDPFADPVRAADGQKYERSAIQDWFDRGNRTSPLFNTEMSDTKLRPA